MSEQIKFRAWHFGLQRMFSAEEMTVDQMALLPNGCFANIHGSYTSKSVIFSHKQMLPLQFTGLLDKNGKEIYVGDVVRISNPIAGVSHIRKVTWNELGFYDNFRELPRGEVIGNIYEDEEWEVIA